MSRKHLAGVLTVVAAGAVLSTTATGSARDAVPGSILSLAPTDPLNDPASPWQIIYGGDMRSDPLPSPAPHVAVTAAGAVAAINRYPNEPMDRTAPRVTLRMVTIGSVRLPPASAPRPMWVLTWSRVDPLHVGGGMNQSPGDHQRLEDALRAQCVRVEAVDAQTRRIYGIYEICSAGFKATRA